VLFPSLLEWGGYFAPLSDVLLAALKSRELPASALVSYSPTLAARLSNAIDRASSYQQPAGIAWRFEKDYWRVRYEVAAACDVAGWLDRDSFEPLLRRAISLEDPRIVTFAAVSLLRQNAPVDDFVLERSAASHETRAILFELLEELGRIDRFPTRWRTWGAFAAADMVQWLCYPAELGREPDHLQLMARFDHEDAEGDQSLYVWRFKNEDADKWYAGTSGSYLLGADPHPISGSSTFSCFDDWDDATAEEHALAVLETLDNRCRHWDADSEGL
jgi:hypothetical protein